MYLIFLFLTLFSGCQNKQNITAPENQIMEQLENELGIYKLSYESDSFQFTDIIAVRLTAESKTGFIVVESLPKPGDHWGDFTVMKRFQDSGQNVRWFLSPDKTGKAVLSGLELSISSSDTLSQLKFTDSEIEIVSSLMNDSAVPADLLPPEESPDFPVYTVLIITAILSLSLMVFLYFKKRRAQRNQEALKNSLYYLQKLKELEKDARFTDDSRKDQYRELYHLLSLFLHGISPSLRIGLEPSYMLKELEKPSSLNQWALRSLYPILGEMEDIFYNPAHGSPDEETLNGHVKTIIDCCEFLQKEEDATHV
ncbi:MAG: hypothetical protein B6241_03950 [Spirochaetaceae bacterium 4572_59]|nr:MAG: hypothetical protein B6241_03950 [Spirochaetaceae bacterium 4572_59]